MRKRGNTQGGGGRGLLAVVFKYSKLNQTSKGMSPMKEVQITVVGKVWNANKDFSLK